YATGIVAHDTFKTPIASALARLRPRAEIECRRRVTRGSTDEHRRTRPRIVVLIRFAVTGDEHEHAVTLDLDVCSIDRVARKWLVYRGRNLVLNRDGARWGATSRQPNDHDSHPSKLAQLC